MKILFKSVVVTNIKVREPCYDLMKLKRLTVCLALSVLFGSVCVYGTTNVNPPATRLTIPYLATVFYNRIILGLMVWLADDVKITGKERTNVIVRGGLLGAIVSVGISFQGRVAPFVGAGIVYGVLTDWLATRMK